MTVFAKPLCAILGHHRDRHRVWNDRVDLRAPCQRCGTALIRTAERGWRPLGPADDHPDRITREAYREQMKREDELSGASADRPDRWATHLIAAFADPARAIEPADLFDRLIDDLLREPAFASAVASGRLDTAARQAVNAVTMRALGTDRALPSHFLDPLARYLHARAQDRAVAA